MTGNYTSTIAGKILQQAAVLSVIMLLSVPPSMADGDMNLTFKVRASRPSCTIASDKGGTISLPNVTSKQLTDSKDITAGGVTFRLTLSNCTSAGGLLVPKIAVWGNRSVGGSYIFSDSASSAKNVGFAFRYDSTGTGSGSWISCPATECTTSANAKKYAVTGNAPGELMNGKYLNFFALVSRDGAPGAFTTGNLRASMHFDLVFE